MRRRLALLAALVAVEVACNDGTEEETRYNMKPGFIPGTKDDVATGHMTLDEGRRRCTAEPKCTAITYHGKPDASGQVFVYLKADTSVAEADKTWTSYIKVCPHASTAAQTRKRRACREPRPRPRRLAAAPVPLGGLPSLSPPLAFTLAPQGAGGPHGHFLLQPVRIPARAMLGRRD